MPLIFRPMSGRTAVLHLLEAALRLMLQTTAWGRRLRLLLRLRSLSCVLRVAQL